MWAHNSNYSVFQNQRITRWNSVAIQADLWEGLGGYYHERINEVYRFFVQPGSRIKE